MVAFPVRPLYFGAADLSAAIVAAEYTYGVPVIGGEIPHFVVVTGDADANHGGTVSVLWSQNSNNLLIMGVGADNPNTQNLTIQVNSVRTGLSLGQSSYTFRTYAPGMLHFIHHEPLPMFIPGFPYETVITAIGGRPPYVFDWVDGHLPYYHDTSVTPNVWYRTTLTQISDSSAKISGIIPYKNISQLTDIFTFKIRVYDGYDVDEQWFNIFVKKMIFSGVFTALGSSTPTLSDDVYVDENGMTAIGGTTPLTEPSTTRTFAVSFGLAYSGLATVGYQLINTSGVATGPRITAGVTGLGAGSYSAAVELPYGWQGTIRWSTDATEAATIDADTGQVDHQKVSVSSAVQTAGSLAGGVNAKNVELQARTGNIRYTMDGVTMPTATVGMLLPNGSDPKAFSVEDLSRIRFCRDGLVDAELNLRYLEH